MSEQKPEVSPLPTYMTNHQLVDAILDGILGKQKSLARWAVSELLHRAERSQESSRS